MFPAAAACVNGLNISSSTPKRRCRECHCSSPTFAPAKVMLLFHGGDNFPWPHTEPRLVHVHERAGHFPTITRQSPGFRARVRSGSVTEAR